MPNGYVVDKDTMSYEARENLVPVFVRPVLTGIETGGYYVQERPELEVAQQILKNASVQVPAQSTCYCLFPLSELDSGEFACILAFNDGKDLPIILQRLSEQD